MDNSLFPESVYDVKNFENYLNSMAEDVARLVDSFPLENFKEILEQQRVKLERVLSLLGDGVEDVAKQAAKERLSVPAFKEEISPVANLSELANRLKLTAGNVFSSVNLLIGEYSLNTLKRQRGEVRAMLAFLESEIKKN